MWYTLAKGWLWFTLAGLLGIVIGWLLRSIVARRQLLRARGGSQGSVGSDADEVEALRRRVAELERVSADNDRLRGELDACREREAATAPATATEPSTASSGHPAAPAGAGVLAPPHAPRVGDIDLSGAAAVLGTAVAADDLKVIEGIGPKIEQLCHGIGIASWVELAATEVSLLRTMLADAGPRFRTHDPASWPQQAGLLAQGRWAEFKALTDELSGGRTTG